MKITINSAVTDLLTSAGIDFDVIEIPLSEDKKPIRNLEELLSNKGLEPKSVVRSILFKGGSEKFYMLAVAGGGRADWGVLRQLLSERKLRMAELNEVSEVTGYVVGAVPPIALPDKVKVLVDAGVRDYETVVIGSGVLGYAIALKGSLLLDMLASAKQGQFVKA